jgi:5-(carboxyamino)imidazole ribonucleotide synthase
LILHQNKSLNEAKIHQKKLGIIGSGQLGKMLLEEAVKWDLNTSVLANEPDAPCRILCREYIVCDSYFDYDAIYNFGISCDVLTIEIEHVNVDALEQLELEGVAVYPQPQVLRTIQDKGLQKQFYAAHKIPASSFELFHSREQIVDAINSGKLKYPFVQKLCKGGYDGKGVAVIDDAGDLKELLEFASVVEEKIEIETEYAVIVSRNASGESVVYDAVEMAFDEEANLLDVLIYPARIDKSLNEKIKKLALDVSNAFGHIGLLAVEMFADKKGVLYVNEVAPRPHNSGHHTIEASICSQFEQHLRAILGLPPGSTRALQEAVMVNLVGAKNFEGPVWYEGFDEALKHPGVFIHLYGKTKTKPFRKMGHITVCSDDVNDALKTALEVKKLIQVKSIQ